MCTACATPDGVCAECAARLSDPYQLQRTFDVVAAMLAGGRLFAAALPGIVLFSLLDVCFSTVLHLLNTTGDVREFNTQHPLMWLAIFGVLGAILKTLPAQTSLALIVARAERVELTNFSALREGLVAWPRTVWAMLRWYLQVSLGTAFFVIPGLWLIVRLVYAPIAAFRVRKEDPLEVSHETLSGRFAEGLVVAVLGYGSSMLLIIVMTLFSTLVKAQGTAIAWPQFVSWFIVALFTNGLLNAFFYAAFMMSTHGSGRALEPMAWHTRPPRAQPSQS